MKTIFRLLCGWMAIALTTACSHEELLQIEPLQKPVAQKTISVKAYTPSEQAATRLAFEDKGAEGLKLSWRKGDIFTALIGGEKVMFAYNESSKEFTAIVNESVTLTDGLKAYYPAYSGENFEKDFFIQTGTLNSATTYMEGVYEGDAFRFTHSTAILKATFSGLHDGATISSIAVSGGVNVTISNPNATISKDSIYINLPAIPKDGQLKFMVETATRDVYTATKTVTAEEGIQTGVYYNTTVALSPAPVCSLPTGDEFNSAVETFLQSNSSLTKIKFVANSSNTNKDNQISNSRAYMVAGSDNTLEIHTSEAEFVFNKDCSGMFSDLINIQSIDFGNCVNTANVTIMGNMFDGCSALTSLDLSSFNTERVINIFFMFYNCSSLTSLDVSSFNTSNVMFMHYMFNNCSALTSLDLSNFNTTNVKFMNYMFNNCSSLNSLDLSSFNTANVTDMDYMFNKCSALTSLDLSSFNTAKVTDMSYMFNSCSALTSLDLSSFNFDKVQYFGDMFTDLGKNAVNKPIPVYVTMTGYNILKDKDTNIPISATYVYPCELPTGSTFNAAVNSFLESNSSLTKIKFIANSATTSENQIETSGAYMVAGSDNTLEIHTYAAEFVFNANCYNMFDGLSTITAIDFNDCVNTLNVTNMGSIFYGCSALTSLDLSSFNTENVTNMGSMFNGCSALTSLDLSSFNTLNVTNMGAMFYKCPSLESLDLSGFNTSNVEIMNFMFYDCKKLSSLNVSSFNTANVTVMVSMFDSCSALESLDLSNFNTANVTNMGAMFSDCYSLTSLELSSFNFSQVTDFEYMFDYLGSSATNTPIPIYVTQAGYNILKDKKTYNTYRYFQYVDIDGTPYSL